MLVSPPSRGARIETWREVVEAQENASPPSRGARIETNLTESILMPVPNRPLHGGRGLKLCDLALFETPNSSPPSRGARIETYAEAYLIAVETIAPFTGGAD